MPIVGWSLYSFMGYILKEKHLDQQLNHVEASKGLEAEDCQILKDA